MIGYIKGLVTEVETGHVTVEASGVGYELIVSSFCARECKTGEQVKLPAYLNVTEAGVTLYGFLDKTEKDMFEKLTAVSGVGAKVAIGILSGITVSDLIACIARGDTVSLSKIKGIGKKTSERIVLELRDKIAREIRDNVDLPAAGDTMNVDEEAVLALMALGFNKNEAIGAVSRVNGENLTPEQIVFKALKG